MAGLEELYKEIIMDHYRNPRNRGELPPPACKAEGFNPMCGDEIVLYVDIDDAGTITNIATGGQGCSISQSSASMMTQAVKGKTADEARQLTAEFKTMMGIEDDEPDSDADAIEAAKASAGAGDAAAVGGAVDKPDLSMGDLSALQGVKKFPVRIKCAVLSWNTLLEALDDAAHSGR